MGCIVRRLWIIIIVACSLDTKHERESPSTNRVSWPIIEYLVSLWLWLPEDVRYWVGPRGFAVTRSILAYNPLKITFRDWIIVII